MTPAVLFCMYWGMNCVRSAVKVRCSRCPQDLAIYPRNIALAIQPICAECMLKIELPANGGVAVGGKLFEDVVEHADVVEWLREVVRRRKTGLAIMGN